MKYSIERVKYILNKINKKLDLIISESNNILNEVDYQMQYRGKTKDGEWIISKHLSLPNKLLLTHEKIKNPWIEILTSTLGFYVGVETIIGQNVFTGDIILIPAIGKSFVVKNDSKKLIEIMKKNYFIIQGNKWDNPDLYDKVIKKNVTL